MVVVRSYRNGVTLGSAGTNPHPPKRGEIKGWTYGAVRRHSIKLFSVAAEGLTGAGYAATLTLRTLPTADQWHSVRVAWTRRVERIPGFVRLHWVVEWQERGTPHLHVAVYGEGWTPLEGWLLIGHWLEAARAFEPTISAQDVKGIDGAVGWLAYMSKHAARGAAHYQRQGSPEGWEKTGRLYGFRGVWPFDEPTIFVPTRDGGYRLRRLLRAWRIADARSALLRTPPDDLPRLRAARRRLVSARRSLKSPDRRLGAVRGMSEWCPEPVMLALFALLEADGQSWSAGDEERTRVLSGRLPADLEAQRAEEEERDAVLAWLGFTELDPSDALASIGA